MANISCDNNCETCGKWTSIHSNGGEYTEYSCIIANKDVKIIYDENGNEMKREIW